MEREGGFGSFLHLALREGLLPELWEQKSLENARSSAAGQRLSAWVGREGTGSVCQVLRAGQDAGSESMLRG